MKVSGHILESSQLRFPYTIYITNQFQTTFARGGGGDPLVEVTVNSKEGKLLRLLSQLCSRIRPQIFCPFQASAVLILITWYLRAGLTMYLPVFLLLFSSLLLLVGGCHTFQGIIFSISNLAVISLFTFYYPQYKYNVWQYIYIFIQYNLKYLFEIKAHMLYVHGDHWLETNQKHKATKKHNLFQVILAYPQLIQIQYFCSTPSASERWRRRRRNGYVVIKHESLAAGIPPPTSPYCKLMVIFLMTT